MRSLEKYFKSENMKEIFNYYSCEGIDRLTLEEILELEWGFFDQVNGLSGRAICQDNTSTFIIMRLAQHLLFSNDTRFSILKDYQRMKSLGINPIEGKYARMMQYTDEELFKTFLDELPEVSPIKRQVIIDIIKIFEKDLEQLKYTLPVTLKYSRPIDNKGNQISSLSYFYAELTYFSYRTLRYIKKDAEEINGQSCVERIFQNTVIINKYL